MKKLKDLKIGITGTGGFIGKSLLRYLRSKELDPEVLTGNMTDISSVIPFVEKCGRIYHIAGKNREEYGDILKNNLVATGNLILSSFLKKKFPEIVFISSTQIEWNLVKSEYAFVKSIEEVMLAKVIKKVCIYRVPNVYGPGSRPFYNSVVATLCYQAARGDELTINDPKSTREFIYIDDLIKQLMKPKFSSYKFVKGEIFSIGKIASFLTNARGAHKNLEKTLKYYEEVVKNERRLSYP